ncbi:MAG: hypothetical protein NT068_03900 [Candidatus Nomurabacteria bacterium]|nr:hypothetical protein [Candidatus Nomurabacteria bacterium]
MTTISVPLSASLMESVENLIKSGYGSNKADVVRRAIIRLAEEEAVNDVLRAREEISLGNGLSGNLRELIKTIK